MFKKLAWKYSIQDGVCYFRHYEIARADPNTFEPLDPVWSRDAERVFCTSKQETKADRDSFQILNRLYAADANYVWTLGGITKEADPKTFEPIGRGWEIDQMRGFGRDKNFVFNYVMTIGKANVVRWADPKSFRDVGQGFGMDEKNVFYERHRLVGAKPKSWQRLDELYSRDERFVFYCHHKLEGADVQSFEVLPSNCWARDRDSFFRFGKRATADEFFAELQKLFIFRGKIVEASVVNKATREVVSGKMELDPDLDGEAVAVKIRCDKWFHRPLESRVRSPDEGDLLEIDLHSYLDFSEWLGRDFVWICYFLDSQVRANKETGIYPKSGWYNHDPGFTVKQLQELLPKSAT